MRSAPADPLLTVRALRVRYAGSKVPAVDGVAFALARGECLGVLGASGSGKSSVAMALGGLLPASATWSGAITFEGVRLDGLDEGSWQRVRGVRLGLVFQQPSLALSPTRRVDRQIADVLRSHDRPADGDVAGRVASMLAELGLDPELGRAHPHQLSGGQRQRVVLAQALCCDPDLLVADEPTASLDRPTEARILDLVDRLRRSRGLSLLWISHDPRVHARLADRLLVMEGGKMVDRGPAKEVLARIEKGHIEGASA